MIPNPLPGAPDAVPDPQARDLSRTNREISGGPIAGDGTVRRSMVEPGMDLILDAWREACRHDGIVEFVERLAPRLARAIPFDALVVRRIELAQGRIETCAALTRAGGATPRRLRTECAPERARELADWCHGGAPLSGTAERGSLLQLLAPPGLDGPWLAGPLLGAGESGVLLLAGASGEEPLRLFRGLLEPFGAALSNDRRLSEMTRLYAAVEADNRALLSRLARHDISESIVGEERGLVEVMERVRKVAPTDAPVLILGETGSGKEVIARAIHAQSPRANGPIVRVNCGAIPPELVDSELFGHEKGAFTGAIQTHRGWFERADGGTLFLDEVGELPAAAQVRLLRILQDGSFERVGGSQALQANVRLIAATNRDLGQMVAQGAFRSDLWYRISVFPIPLPPLRERASDVPDLARHFARGAGLRLGGVPLVPSAADIALLQAYPWPGNVRELAAVIERAAILGDGKRLEVAAALGGPPSATAGDGGSAEGPPPAAKPDQSLDGAVRRHIEEALGATRGRIEGESGAARLLGVNPHTLRARMRKLGIDWQRFRGTP
jgi:transcriptional regulator with GAF, ATPase, and Fis domain